MAFVPLRPSRWRRLTVATVLSAGLLGCSRHEPPTWDSGVTEEPHLPPSSIAAAAMASPPVPSAPIEAPAPSAEAPKEPASAPPLAEPPPDDGALPQTKDEPSSKSPALLARAQLLAAAIAEDAPEKALPFFFPKAAYEQVKDVTHPAADWKIRLVAAYLRDIRDDRRKLGARAKNARFVGIEVPDGRTRWVEPGEEYNKLGYYRVFGSRLVFDVEGRRRTLEIKSLISWRGEWFVVHLAGMK